MIDRINALESPEKHINDLCASFQNTVIKTVCHKTIEACQHKQVKQCIIAGGVAANRTLVNTLKSQCDDNHINLIIIEPKLCTDNAAMIGLAATHLGNIYHLSIADITAKSTFNYAI